MTIFKEYLQKIKEEFTSNEEFAKANPGLQERLEKIEKSLVEEEKPNEEEKEI